LGRTFSLIKRTIAVWWREVILWTFFNVAWFVLQVLIVTGPPATAAMYVIARRVLDDELLHPLAGWSAMRQMFWPAWKWGIVNLVLVTILAVNFRGYWETASQGWVIIRLLWAIIAFAWFALNLFYWPFWLIQSDRRMVNTYRNSLVLLLKMPAFVLTLALISAVLVVSSVLLSLLLVIVLMAWLALMGTLAVDGAVREQKSQSTQ
jgi:hypothetical protein